MLRIVIITLFVIFFSIEHAECFDLDMTVDDDIRKNYNSSQLQKDTNTESLPDLPVKLLNDNNPSVSNYEKITPPKQILSNGNVKIPDGTVFNVVSNSQISDWQPKGTSLKFTLKNGISGNNFSIPAGTIFFGEIAESHQPQISGNGGLVSIKVMSMSCKGEIYPINAYITKANDKNIFFNDIKGERNYLKTMWKKGNWGRSVFNRMTSVSVRLSGQGSKILLSPFPLAYGTICLGLNTITSPISAFFNKGGHVNIPAGSDFKIKLLEEAYIN